VVATQRAVAFAEQRIAVYIVHLSSARALEVCADAQGRGVPVFVETGPMYLHLTEERLREAEPGRYIGQPPLRSAADARALWAGLASGAIATLCTDHAPWSLAAKLDPELSIAKLRPGVENLQTMLPMLYSEGVRSGRISLGRLVELTSSNAARVRALPAQGRGGRRQRRRPGRVRPRADAYGKQRPAALERGLFGLRRLAGDPAGRW
jgi:dihydropyrimidinase